MSEFSWIIIIRITQWYAPPCTMYPEDCDFKEKSPWCQLIYPLETNTVMQADMVTGNLIWCKVGGHILELINKKASASAAHHLPGSSTDGGGSKRTKETKPFFTHTKKAYPSHSGVHISGLPLPFCQMDPPPIFLCSISATVLLRQHCSSSLLNLDSQWRRPVIRGTESV